MFLHGTLKEEVYVEKPHGFKIHNGKNHVCRIKKALYGLKQAPKAWYARIDSYLMKLIFMRSNVNLNFYFKFFQGMPHILVLYVNDLSLTVEEPIIF